MKAIFLILMGLSCINCYNSQEKKDKTTLPNLIPNQPANPSEETKDNNNLDSLPPKRFFADSTEYFQEGGGDIKEFVSLRNHALKHTLSQKNKGQEYVFKRNSENKILEFYVTYLGSMKIESNELRFLGVITLTGTITPTGDSYIYIFGRDDEMIGFYYTGSASGIFPEIKGQKLVIQDTLEGCSIKNIVDFQDGIPQEFFVECNDGFGDFYVFVNHTP